MFISEKRPQLQELIKQKNKLYDYTMKLLDENNKLSTDISTNTIKLYAVQKKHADWIPYPHFACDDEISKQTMKKNENDVTSVNEQNCMKQHEMLNTNYTSLLNIEYEKKVNFVRDCENNKLLIVPYKSIQHHT